MNYRILVLASVIGSLAAAACTSPVASTPLKAAPVHGTPATVELTASPGIGANGGRATITIRVIDAYTQPVSGVSVALTSSSGTITPEAFTSDTDGRGNAVLNAPAGVVTVTASVNGHNATRSTLVAVQPINVPPDPIPNPPPPPPPPIPTPTPPPKPAPPGPAPTPVPLFTRSGTGASVFDLPTSVSRVRITADYGGFCENFIVHIAGAGIVNEILGTCGTGSGPHFGGTFSTSGGRVDVLNSTGITWTFTEVR